MRREFKKLVEFSFSDWLTLFYIYILFLFVELGFRLLDFSTMVKLISVKYGEPENISGVYPQRELYLVTVASRYNFFKVTCLNRSFVLFRLLKRRGNSPVLCIGVQKDKEFNAHAWVEIDGSPVLDCETRTCAFKRMLELTCSSE